MENILARAQIFSSCKYCKFLLGISQQGVIGYISKGWGEFKSDKFLTENYDFLDNLLPGDIVMTDRGFDIEQSLALYCAKVKIPSFTKGTRQLSSLDVKQSQRMAVVRIYVETVICIVQNKYPFFQGILPYDFLMKKEDSNYCTIDKIVCVTYDLVNLCDSVIPFKSFSQ